MTILHYHGMYSDYDVYLQVGRYSIHFDTKKNGPLAIKAFDARTDEPAFIATVNLPEHTINSDEAFIKDYGENQGVLAFLRENGIVTDIVKHVRSGYVDIPLCKIDLDKLKSLI